MANSHHYTFYFTLEYGATSSPFVGAATYDFGYVVENSLLATLSGVWMSTTCDRELLVIPPFASPQPVLLVHEVDWGYSSITLSFTPPRDDDDACFEEGAEGVLRLAPAANAQLVPGNRTNDVECGSGGGGNAQEDWSTCYWFLYDDGSTEFIGCVED